MDLDELQRGLESLAAELPAGRSDGRAAVRRVVRRARVKRGAVGVVAAALIVVGAAVVFAEADSGDSRVVTEAPSTIVVTATTTASQSQSTTAAAVTRNAHDWLQPGEILDGTAVSESGTLWFAVTRRTSFPAGLAYRCTAALYRVDPGGGARERVGDGVDPRLSPDGSRLTYSGVRRLGDECGLDQIVVLDPVTNAVLAKASTPFQVGPWRAWLKTWSPLRNGVTVMVGEEHSDVLGWYVLEPATAAMTAVVVDPTLAVSLTERLGLPGDAAADWQPLDLDWSSDGSLIATLGTELRTYNGRFRVPASGVITEACELR